MLKIMLLVALGVAVVWIASRMEMSAKASAETQKKQLLTLLVGVMESMLIWVSLKMWAMFCYLYERREVVMAWEERKRKEGCGGMI